MALLRTCDPKVIGRALCENPVANAYMLGYLDPAYADACSWFVETNDGSAVGIMMVYRGLSRPALFTSGTPAAIETIVAQVRDELPDRVSGHIPFAHRDAIGSVYRAAANLKSMHRMGLQRRMFDRSHSDGDVVRLSHPDTAAIMAVYGHWPDNFFEPVQLETGLYFGIRAEDGSLASIAGIHNVSERFDIAAIGNLVTHPDHRSKGYAKLVTARLLAETTKLVSLVTLDVQQDNEPAIRTYRHFGFRHHEDLYEGELIRR